MCRCFATEYEKIGSSKANQIFPPMDRVVLSEFIQYNRVGSTDLNFTDISRNNISLYRYKQKQYFQLILIGDFAFNTI